MCVHICGEGVVVCIFHAWPTVDSYLDLTPSPADVLVDASGAFLTSG